MAPIALVGISRLILSVGSLRAGLLAEPAVRDLRLVVDVLGEQRIVLPAST
jgi:hypothetical protein